MKHICIYFQIHHPFHFQTFRFIDVGTAKCYYDAYRNEREIYEAANNYYLPTNKFLHKLIVDSGGKLKITFHISGPSIDQFLLYSPEVISSFRQLAESGQVEFTGGTNSHSIVSLTNDEQEFRQQILLGYERIEHFLGQKPKLFVNTDLIYTNHIAETVSETGYKMLLTNGAGKILHWRSPNRLYCGQAHKNLKILFRNEPISNELAESIVRHQFQPQSAHLEQFLSSANTIQPDDPFVNIYLNYKYLGGEEMNAKQKYFRSFVSKILNEEIFSFSLPSELMEKFGPVAEIETETPVCWCEHFHPSYFPGNELQQEAIRLLFRLKQRLEQSSDPYLKCDWQNLQTSDHFHLMDENHPMYHTCDINQSNCKSKYDAFINFMNILEDFTERLKHEKSETSKQSSGSQKNHSKKNSN